MGLRHDMWTETLWAKMMPVYTVRHTSMAVEPGFRWGRSENGTVGLRHDMWTKIM